ncbi:MAG: carboxylating nicotinate-nucleotide diphosphorylase [Ignavibacteriae bacterium]|nr:carboxylating nicotinate-nucleotide diphosphorylase [Ignavibacteriota bacterium]
MNIEEEYLKNLDVLIKLAISEDINTGDITTDAIISKSNIAEGFLKAKQDGIICGLKVAELVFNNFDENIKWQTNFNDGDKIISGSILANFSGKYNSLLSAERIALNFIQRMSAISTKTFHFVNELKGTKTKLLDTRKTIPGFRLLDKYAVKIGGGTNHRFGLYDLVMIKDNHIEVAGSISNAVKQVREKYKNNFRIEVETRNINEVQEALNLNVDIIMLDNMSIDEMKSAVKLIGGEILTEASGNITFEKLKAIAETGVDFISVGELTHSVKAFDIGMYIK